MTSKKFASREEMLKTIKLSNKLIQKFYKTSQEQRFALFSYKTPTSICDTQFTKKFHPTDENHRVIIDPRNVQTTNVKSGKIKSSYFSVPGFTTIGDPYVDPERRRRLEELGSKLKSPQDQGTFKPQHSFKAICGTVPYKHDTNLKGPQAKTKIRCQQQGNN